MPNPTFLDFVRSQWTRLPPVESVDLSGQTVVVTGSNTGLGLEAVKHFARMGPKHLVIVCRSQSKGEQAVDEVETETGVRPEVLLMDMSDFSAVSAFATAFQERYDRLDILICNAGIAATNYESTRDGWESTIGVNHLSTALISILLMPLMVKTAQNHDTYPRLVIVASETHSHVDITPEVRAAPAILAKLSDKEFCVERNGANMSTRYPVSKLLNVFFTRAFAAHLAPSSAIIADYVNPGFCYSGLSRNAPFPASLVFMVMKLALGRRTAEGAKTLVWAATAGHNDASVRDSLKGAYSSDCRIAAPSDFALSDEGQKIQSRLWDETLAILAKVDARVSEIAGEYLVV